MSLKSKIGKLGKYVLKLLVPVAVLIGIAIWLWTPSGLNRQESQSTDFQEKPILLTDPKLYEFSSNDMRVQITAHRAEIFERSRQTKLIQIHATFFRQGGVAQTEAVVITANYGRIDHETDFVTLWGDVLLALPDDQKITTEELFIQGENSVIYNDGPVRITQRQDVVTASSFRYNYRENILELSRPQMTLKL